MRLSEAIQGFADHPRLTECESRRLIARAQAGDEKARQKLLKSSGLLLKHLLLHFQPPEALQEDLMQEALIGINQAITSYQPGRGSKWSTYCYGISKRKMLNALSKANRYTPEAYPNPDNFMDPKPDDRPEEMFFGVCDKLYVQEHLKLLPSREAHVAESCWGIHGDPEMIKDVSERLGVTRQRTSELRNQALRHLYDNLTSIPDYPPAQLKPFAYLEAG